ncbi:hypothetical protein [Longispora urticae]
MFTMPGSLQTKLTDLYPDLTGLRRAIRSADWAAVAGYFAALPDRADRSVAVRLVAETPRSERFLERMLDTERESSLVRTLLGARLIVLAWQARSAAQSQYVSMAQWQIFHDLLNRAERVLADATALDPTNAAAWTERIIVARGLSLPNAEARRRHDRAAEYCDAPFVAESQLVQNLCPKWGGSTGALHAFTQERLRTGRPGTLAGAAVAHAHIEHALTFDYISMITDRLGERQVRDELVAAAEQTVLHPEFRPVHGWVAAHSAFAFAFWQGGYRTLAAPHFAALGRRATSFGWDNLDDKWRKAFRTASRTTRKG